MCHSFAALWQTGDSVTATHPLRYVIRPAPVLRQIRYVLRVDAELPATLLVGCPELAQRVGGQLGLPRPGKHALHGQAAHAHDAVHRREFGEVPDLWAWWQRRPAAMLGWRRSWADGRAMTTAQAIATAMEAA